MNENRSKTSVRTPKVQTPSRWWAVPLAAALWTALPARAVTVYTIDTTITSAVPTGNPLQTDSVVGTLTTDGTVGALAAGNIVGWNLALIDRLDATNNITLTRANSQLVEDGGGALSATASALFFDFSGRGEFLIQVSPYSGFQYFCFSTGGACLAGETIAPNYVSGDGVVLTGAATPVGNQGLDQNPPTVAAVPEPSSWVLLAMGGAALAVVRRGRGGRPGP